MLRLAVHALGTRVELVLADESTTRVRAAGEAALEAVVEFDGRWSRFRSDSFLAHIVRGGFGRPVQLDAGEFELFEICQRVQQASSGAFDVSLGTCARFDLDGARRTIEFQRASADRELVLDLGAIGKGHALELAANVLREAGIEAALIHAGTSSVVALGAPPQLTAWNVALEGGAGAPVIGLCDESLSVSGQHRQRNDSGGHILDPRTGAAARGDALVAVIHRDARIAEAWSTALIVLEARADALGCVDEDATVHIGDGSPGSRAWRSFTCCAASNARLDARSLGLASVAPLLLEPLLRT